MAFRSRGRQGLSRMSAAPRQTSRIRSRSTVSKYGGRVSTRPAPKSTGDKARRNRISSYNNPDGSSGRYMTTKSGHIMKSEWVNKKTSKINPGTTVEGVSIKTKTGRKMAQGTTQPVTSKKRNYTSDNTYKTVRTGETRTIKGAKPISRSAPKKVAKGISRAKITGKIKTGAKAGKLSVRQKSVRRLPRGTTVTTRGGPRGTSKTIYNKPIRKRTPKRNPRRSLSDEYADLGGLVF
tara:strand:- start:1102 stop:1809 length:708 start_codon:yes stop_codon:yes gene_type:complete